MSPVADAESVSNGKVCNINADPVAIESLGDGYRRAATTERIQHRITDVATRFYYALKEGFWLLRGVSNALIGLRINRINVAPHVWKRKTGCAVQKLLVAW